METIKLENKPFLVIGSSGQEKVLTQSIVNKYISIAINRSLFNVDIIFRCDRPPCEHDFNKCRYFCTDIEYKKYPKYQNEKCKFFKQEYKIISDRLPVLGIFKFSVTAVLNFISIVAPESEVYLVGINHTKGKYKDPAVNRFIERYKNYLKLYQTDFNSKGWNLEYKEIK